MSTTNSYNLYGCLFFYREKLTLHLLLVILIGWIIFFMVNQNDLIEQKIQLFIWPPTERTGNCLWDGAKASECSLASCRMQFVSFYFKLFTKVAFMLWTEALFIYYCIAGAQRAVRSSQADRPSDRTYARQSDGVIWCQDELYTYTLTELWALHQTLSKVI